jgi:hypothetical protein
MINMFPDVIILETVYVITDKKVRRDNRRQDIIVHFLYRLFANRHYYFDYVYIY